MVITQNTISANTYASLGRYDDALRQDREVYANLEVVRPYPHPWAWHWAWCSLS